MSFPWNITNPGFYIDGLLTSVESQYVTDLVLASSGASENEVLTWKSGAPSWEAAATVGGYTNLTQFVDQTPWRVFYSNGSGDVTELALGADGTYLKSNGASAAPSFAAPSGSGDVVGPASAADSNFAAFNLTTGKIIKDSGSKASDFATAGHNHAGVYAPALGADDNYVTDAEKTKLGHISITQAVDLDALEAASHAAVTVEDSAEIDFILTGQQITASLKSGSIDESKLDESVNASLDLADTAVQPAGLSGYFQTANIDDTPVNGETAAPISSNWAYDHAATAASDTAAGHVELAIASELNTGTDATRAVTPDALSGSNFGIRYHQCTLNGTTALTTSDKYYFRIPAALTGMNLVSVRASVGTGAAGSSSSGTPTFTAKNVTDNAQMLSTNLTVDAGHYTSTTATIAAVINTATDDVVTDDLIEVACTVAGTGVTYATITLGFQLP